MSYYSLSGARHLAGPDFSAIGRKKVTWHLAVATVFVMTFIGVVSLVTKTSASPEPARFNVQPSNVISQPPTPVKSVVPAVAQAPDHSPELYNKLEAWRKSQTSSDFGFYVSSIDSDELKVGVNHKSTFTMANIYKMFLLKPLAQQVPAEAWQNRTINNKSYQTCVEIMLSLSDNPCAEAFGNTIGWSSAQGTINTDGYKQTTINSLENFTTTASDAGLLLERLYNGEGYDAKTRQIALDAMVKPKSIEGIRSSCPKCTVYNKTGYIADVKHDAAIIEKGGKAYVVVIMSSDSSWSKISESASIIASYL